MIVDLSGIFGYLADVLTDKRKHGFLGVETSDTADTFYRFLIIDITPQSINGVGRIDDNTTLFQAAYHLFYFPARRVIGIDSQQHRIVGLFVVKKVIAEHIGQQIPKRQPGFQQIFIDHIKFGQAMQDQLHICVDLISFDIEGRFNQFA